MSHENVADAELGMCSMPTKGAVASSITKALALAGVKPDEVEAKPLIRAWNGLRQSRC